MVAWFWISIEGGTLRKFCRMIRWRLLFVLLTAVALSSASFAAEKPAPSTVANGEELVGSWLDKEPRIAEFRGIPFASPPVGPLRWRAPQPHLPRSGPQFATTFAAACMQGSGGVDWYVGVAKAFGHGPEVVSRPVGISEDCLYLNVWTPAPGDGASKPRPVMVFVHGGSNSGGWSYEPNYLGTNLAARGVVVVTVAYRLGPFGFFAHPALTEDSNGAVANFALLDIRAAFQWVKDNIGAFGGDPENITGFGESAGAFDLVDLLLADLAVGKGRQSLFRRLISQSIGGPSIVRQSLDEGQATGVLLAEHLGLGGEATATDLRQVAARDILDAAQKLPEDHYFSAVVGGDAMPAYPLAILRNMQASGIDLLAGTNADEWYMYISERVTRKDLEQWIESNAPAHQDALLAAVADEADPRRAMDRLRTARNMLCPSRYLAMQVSEGGGRGRVYYFSRQRAGAGGQKLGAYHGAELPYVFNSHDQWMPVETVDMELTESVMDYWVRFATTGDPNGPGRPAWPVYNRQNPVVMELGDRTGEMESFDLELCELLGPESQSLEVRK